MSRMPVLFIGHGSPMNLILDNDYTQGLKKLGKTLPQPKSICVFSAHWQTQGTLIHCAGTAKQIFDFYGFPQELYSISYAPAGDPETAEKSRQLAHLERNDSWGNDHAAWSVLYHMYPDADIPVFYISSDMTAGYKSIFDMASSLKSLRDEGVLFIGSGNIVHNLRAADFYNVDATPDERGVRFDNEIKQAIIDNYTDVITDPSSLGSHVRFSIPTRDHYIPFVAACGLRDEADKITFPCESFQNSSVSMRSVMFSG